MIARLVGKLAETSADSAIVDVQGVGYLVQASSRTLDLLGPVGGDVTILTELQVREDGWTLFGFGSTGEREAFRQLTSVQGVGGRVALAILSVLDPGELAAAVSQGDKAMVARANGVGTETCPADRQRTRRKAGCAGIGRYDRCLRPARRRGGRRPFRPRQSRLQAGRGQRRGRRSQ